MSGDSLVEAVQRLIGEQTTQARAEGVREGREQAAQAIETDDGFDHRYEQGYAARIARSGSGDARRVTDAAWHSVWLHSNWRWLTSNMTTEEKNAVADAVQRHWAATREGPEDDVHPDALQALRWWR